MTTFLNRARMTVASAPGTGSITLGSATAGFQSFAAAGLTDGQTVTYVAEDTGNAWEVGTGVYTASGTILARTLVASSTGSLLSLTSAAVVYVTIGAADANLWDQIAAEVAAARGGVATLPDMVLSLLRSASGHAIAPIINRFYENKRGGTASSTQTGVANRFDLTPWPIPSTQTWDQFGVDVSTAVASALGKVQIYGSDASNNPTTLLYESGDLDFSTTGYKFGNPSLTLEAGKWYWFGVRHSSTATIRGIALSDAFCLSRGNSGSGATQDTGLRRSLTYATAAPNPFSFSTADLAGISPAVFRWRVSA